MSTHDVPGADPAHNDELAAGCWAEHEDGSLIFVKGTEAGQVVYEIYDVGHDPVVFYQDAMRETAFKSQFSWSAPSASPVAGVQWTWHDKTPFPWDRVMKAYSSPVPVPAEATEQLSAASRIAESLKLRAEKLHEADARSRVDRLEAKGRSILGRIKEAVEVLTK